MGEIKTHYHRRPFKVAIFLLLLRKGSLEEKAIGLEINPHELFFWTSAEQFAFKILRDNWRLEHCTSRSACKCVKKLGLDSEATNAGKGKRQFCAR